MKRKTTISFMIILIIILQIMLSLKANAYEAQETKEIQSTLYVKLKRDEIDSNKINITATEATYNITELKYVHKYIELSDINYFEQNNSDVYTFSIVPSKQIQSSFQLEGYGSYTVYAKNSRGDRFLSRITIKDSSELPDINLTRDTENPLHITIEVTSKNNIIRTLKIAKKGNMNDTIDFSKEGTNIEFIPNAYVNVKYTQIVEPGIYVIYAEDNQGNKSIFQTYLGTQSIPIQVNISDGENTRQVKIEVTDTICNIKKIKVAKESEIATFEDFKTKGEELSFVQGKIVNITYTAPEDNTYVFYIEDEAGYKKMVQKRITEEEKSIKITVSQLDSKNKGDLTIYATNNICNIVKMKVAIGNNVDIDYFKNHGEEITITKGKNVTGKYVVTKNCILNIYVEDEQGYSYMLTKNIIGIDIQEPKEKPKIELTQDTDNLKQINVIVTGEDSYIRKVKWAEGSQTIEYFENNGNVIGAGNVGKIIKTNFIITKTGIYTIYTKDEAGNEVTKEIVISNIKQELLVSDVYEIDDNNKMILKIFPKTTKDDFDKLIVIRDSYKIIDNNGSELQLNEIIGTGMKLKLSESTQYTLVVRGDISGDGNVTTTDLLKAKRHVIGIETLDEMRKKAGDVNLDGKVTTTDILQIKRNIIGIEKF